MSYLDDLSSIFGHIASDDERETVDAAVVVEGETPLDIARRQLSETKTCYFEQPEGTFCACGSRFGVGFAEAVAVVDAETGLADIDINANLHLSPENLTAARKLCRRLNQTFIIPGLVVDDEGWLHFIPDEPCNLLDGDDLADFLGKGFSTVHGCSNLVSQLEAGRSAWDVLHSFNEDDDDEQTGGMLDALRRLMS